MEWSVSQGRPKSLEDAVRLALEYKAFQQARGRRDRPTVRMQREEPSIATANMDNTPQVAPIDQKTEQRYWKKGRCFYCKKDGHIKSECRLLKEHIKTGRYRGQGKPEVAKNVTSQEQGNAQ